MSLGKLQKIAHFFGSTDSSLPPIFLNSMPKAGTNLLEKYLILRGYRRSFHNTYNEHNVGNKALNGSPGRFKVGHLFADDLIHGSAFKTIFVHRRLWSCVRSYVNYMFMDTTHQASSYVREGVERGETEQYLEKLIFENDNPLGRSVLFEYVRFYELDLERYDLVVSFERFKAQDPLTSAHLAQLLTLSRAEGADLMRSALCADTWTKNDGTIDIFKELETSYVENLSCRIDEVDRFVAPPHAE